MVSCTEQEFVREFSKQIINSSAALFIGSGLSRSAGYTDWKGMLKEAAEDIGLDVEKENDLISLAQYYVNSKKRVKINKAISEYFSQPFEPTETHRILSSLPITSYWTTNYDTLLERTFEEMQLSYSVLTNDRSFHKFINGSDIVVHKLHGDVNTPNEAVITKHDYEQFVLEHEILLAKLKGEMCSKSFLFLGYGFNDTDINHILTRIRLFYKCEPPQNHYCLLEKITRKRDEQGNYTETEEDFEYRQRKQEHRIIDLESYGIRSVIINSYKTDIPRLLLEIRKRVYIKNVFISGACEPDHKDVALYAQFAKTLSAWLITRKYKIISGYGNTIGAEVVAGADDGCRLLRQEGFKKLNEYLSVFPFPYKKRMSDEEREKVYNEYRKKIIGRTGICIIINGTKKKNVISKGVLNEAKIAQDLGCLVIPIAITGGAAKQIWDEMNCENNANAQSSNFQMLNSKTGFNDVYNAIISMIEQYVAKIS